MFIFGSHPCPDTLCLVRNVNNYRTRNCQNVEALQLQPNTQSHWSKPFASHLGGNNLICVPGMHPHLQVNWVLLLAMSLCIGDPTWWITGLTGGPPLHPAPCHMVTTDVITHHLLIPVPFRSLQVPPPRNILTGQSPCQFAGGGSPMEALQLQVYTQSHWSSGSTVCFPLRGAAVCILGKHQHNRTGFSC